MYFPKLSLLILLPLLSVETLKADRILLRDGSEIECTIKLVNDTDVKYLVKRNDQLLSASTSDIYMLKYDKRGNVYITSDCKRITGSDREIPKGADVVYLVKGEELPAFNLSVLSNTNMPQSSYMLINNGSNNYTLKITDATQFWGITNYLVIQTE